MGLPERPQTEDPWEPDVIDVSDPTVPAGPVGGPPVVPFPVIVIPPPINIVPRIVAPPVRPAEPPQARPPAPAPREQAPPSAAEPPPASAASANRAGYSEVLRTAGVRQLLTLAGPGVGGLLLLTAGGGFIGYRQAKSGHAVKHEGISRFLQQPPLDAR